MKVNGTYVVREVAGEYVVVPTESVNVNFHGLISLNESGLFLWKRLQDGAEEEELVSAMLEEYEVEEETAREDVRAFLAELEKNQILER